MANAAISIGKRRRGLYAAQNPTIREGSSGAVMQPSQLLPPTIPTGHVAPRRRLLIYNGRIHTKRWRTTG